MATSLGNGTKGAHKSARTAAYREIPRETATTIQRAGNTVPGVVKQTVIADQPNTGKR